MITIVNKTGHLNGVNLYEIRINEGHIVSFYHNREDGLSKCLFLAAEAVRKQQEFNHRIRNLQGSIK